MSTTRMQKINTQILYHNMQSGLGDLLAQDDDNKDFSNCSPLDFSNPDCRYNTPVLLGSGGMKHVYSVQDTLTGRKVAMAVLKNIRCANDLQLFLDEAKVTSKLEHPNIIPIYDMGNDDKGEPFFTMRLMNGETLADNLRRESQTTQSNKIPLLNDKLSVFIKICDAIAFAHSKDILHLDLKPENVQIGEYGEVLVIDWGLAFHVFDESLQKDKRKLCGTPGFIAPELKKKVDFSPDRRCDIYSLGVMFRCLLTLSGPLDKSFYLTPENVPSSLIAIAEKAMHQDPELRYQSVNQLSNDLKRHMSGFATIAEDASQKTLLYLFCRRNLKTILACCAFALILSIVLHYMQDNAALNNRVKRVHSHPSYITKMSSEELIENSQTQLKQLNTAQAELFINQAFILEPDNPEIIYQCANVHLADLHFLAAYQKYQLLDKRYKDISRTCYQFSQVDLSQLSFKQVSPVIDFLYEQKSYDCLNNLFLKLKNTLNSQTREELFAHYIHKFNPGLESAEFDKPSSLVIKGNQKLIHCGPLLLLDLKVLDISKIGSQSISLFDNMGLSSIHLNDDTLKLFKQRPGVSQVFVNGRPVNY